MKAETKEQIRAKLNLAEDAFARLEAEYHRANAEWRREVENMKPSPRIVAAAFASGLLLGAVITLAVRY